jgi:PAS domain S-box-containing protein
VLVACILQFRRGERQPALVLGAGTAWFIITVIVDILVDLGIAPLYLGDFGFLGFAVVLGLQLTSEVIQTEEELADYRQGLEVLIEERTHELDQSERTARALLNAPHDSALLIDPEGIVLDINAVAAERLGTTEAEAAGSNVYDLLEPSVVAARRDRVAEVIATAQPVRWEDTRSGRTIDNNLYPVLDDESQVMSIAVFGADITERRHAQDELRKLLEAEAVGEERSRIARDLHDSVTQTVYSASLIAEALPRVWDRDPELVPERLTALVQLIRGALAEMRTLLFELRPDALEEASLGRLLHQQADMLTGRTQIPVEVTVQGEAELPPEVKIALYRIAQEAFNNIVKHAGATQVAATLRFLPDKSELALKDNGRGFDPGTVPAECMGLRIMRERAESVGATVDIGSALGHGTKVLVNWTKDE